jgi:hypothetical protein
LSRRGALRIGHTGGAIGSAMPRELAASGNV